MECQWNGILIINNTIFVINMKNNHMKNHDVVRYSQRLWELETALRKRLSCLQPCYKTYFELFLKILNHYI